MAMYKSRRRSSGYTPRRSYGKNRGSTRRSKTSLWSKATLGKYVRAEAQKVLKSSGREPRSLSLKALPVRMSRTSGAVTATATNNSEWEVFIQGRRVDDRYVMLPISEAVPPRMSRLADGDGRFRTSEKVLIKGVSVRMTISQAERLRIQAFAFQNTVRRGDTVVASAVNRPWGDRRVLLPIEGIAAVPAPMAHICYEVMDKRDVMGTHSTSPLGRQLGLHDGPFATRRGVDNGIDSIEWKSVDGTSFTSRYSKDVGRPVGQVQVQIDGKKRGKPSRTLNMLMEVPSLMRTVGFNATSSALGSGWIATKHHLVEISIKLNKVVEYRQGLNAVPVSELPYELFLAIDSPRSLNEAGKADTVAGAVTAMEYKIYYERL
ncbi:uncharacterized protein EAF01_011002 [Botrytis porri]|uniref:Uncharacterized protein n=1 Tax=Botrytis porri TaxID=87229 RepID=A0A4Z1KDK3_9HELO|nr:uncharacterized protein EAF01_011002 [Botrytis porri]KAF7887848.1 hypothetical protein EAF01_011002 [Botrytis porri]TGO84161.1 hypothetical protein BPOR_0541g00020 [Botrytis porri]